MLKTIVPITFILFIATWVGWCSNEWINYNSLNSDKPELLIIPKFYNKKDFKKIESIILQKNKELHRDARMCERETYLFKKTTDDHSELYKLLYNEKFTNTVEKYINLNNNTDDLNDRHIIANDYPIEYRRYDAKSNGMAWHTDIALFDGKPYYECVLTLSNTSNSHFEYIDKNGIQQSIYTTPNTLICVMPNVVPHYVSPTQTGERTILKFIAIFDGNVKNKNYDDELEGKKYFT